MGQALPSSERLSANDCNYDLKNNIFNQLFRFQNENLYKVAYLFYPMQGSNRTSTQHVHKLRLRSNFTVICVCGALARPALPGLPGEIRKTQQRCTIFHGSKIIGYVNVNVKGNTYAIMFQIYLHKPTHAQN